MANDAVQLEFLLAGLRDTSGNPLVGGKVHTYEAGTTTNKVTWEDADKAVAEDNPIILDGNGQKEVFADGLYRIIVKDADDVTLYDWDYLEFQKGFRDVAETVSGVKTFSDGIKADTIDEVTAANGVVIDGVKCKDNDVYADALEEKTAGAGINIDTSGAASVLIKDGVISADTINEKTVASGVTIETVLIKDGAIVTPLKIDTINEETAANGVTVDGLNIKDGKLNTNDSVIQSNLSNLAVGQAELKTTTGSVQTTTSGQFLLPGGQYGFYPELQLSTGGTAGTCYIANDLATLSGWVVENYYTTIYIAKTGSGSMFANQRYIQASPPYNLGNGDIPLFIYALINKSTAKVEATYVAEDPPWAYNGSKRINPKKVLVQDGVKYLKRTIRPWSHAEAKTDKARFIENLAAVKNHIVEYVEITHALKNAGMLDIPHPFMSHDQATHAVVLLDPCSPLCGNLHELAQESNEGTSEISEILYAGRIKFDNTPINGLITPPGVMGVRMRLG
jgi:hypothetical protein